MRALSLRLAAVALAAVALAAVALAPAAGAQPSTASLLASLSDEPGSTAWSDAVEAILVGRYDRNRSGTIDTRLELALVDCSVWQELERQHPDVLEIYGFAPDYIWVGYAFGFDEGLRSPAYQTAFTCLHPGGETVQLGSTYTPPSSGGDAGTDDAVVLLVNAVPAPGSIDWKHNVGTILVAAYDRNGSNDLDTRAEVDAIGCRAWGAVQDGYSRGSGTFFWVGYGFPSHLIWNAESLGFDERVRADAWAAIQRCFDTETGRLRSGGGGYSSGGSTAARLASFSGADYSAWTDAVYGVIVPAYDRNGSGDLDTPAEIDALSCEDWRAMETSHNRDSGYTQFWVSAGFPSHLIWNADGMGFAEGMRAYAWGAIQRCIPEAD